ncbi:unnamed protein product [Phaedon cochleariae]|uniref:Knr4/Smi1-like domain-containing protein n=1 Tax=Phaedon cochleariae TaxID=80249 RepID=A0A9N9SHI9_PHACE|nr:unnamed protein product [Phaedon cochleariae]
MHVTVRIPSTTQDMPTAIMKCSTTVWAAGTKTASCPAADTKTREVVNRNRADQKKRQNDPAYFPNGEHTGNLTSVKNNEYSPFTNRFNTHTHSDRHGPKMGFVVDKVSEDSFYENLLLGLSKVLERSPCVSNLSLKRIPGVRQMEIRSWEHNNGIILPEDLRAFYSSTNGFLYTYDFSYDYTSTEEGKRFTRQGKIEVNPLSELIRTYGYETKNVSQIEKTGTKYKLTLSRDSQVYELCTVDENAKVVLVYINSYSIPSVWLYTNSMTFNRLSEDFTTYMRMCIAHLGIPCWQYTVAREGLPDWAREMFVLLAPGVLREDQNLIETPKFDVDVLNRIDANIFSLHSVSNDRGAVVKAVQQDKSAKEKKKIVPRRHMSAKAGKKSGLDK